jgi:hypothetical protein
MLRFEPPEILGKLQKAKSLLGAYLSWDWLDVCEENFNPPSGEDDELGDGLITLDTLTKVSFAHSIRHDVDEYRLTVRELIDLADQFGDAKLIDSSMATSKNTSVAGVTSGNDSASALVSGFPVAIDDLSISLTISIDENEYKASLTRRPNLFALLLEREYGASFGDYDCSQGSFCAYVMIKHDNSPGIEVLRRVIRSFLFALASSYQLVFSEDSFELFDECMPWDETLNAEMLPVDETGKTTMRLRPIDTSLGMDELYGLYMQGCSTPVVEYKILSYAKILEFCGESYLRLRTHTNIDSLLCLPAALNPDAAFIDRLIAVVKEHRESVKLGLTMQMLIKDCCTALEFCGKAPACLKALKDMDADTKEEEKRKALESLSQCIVATRNQIVHAKPSYEKTGLECPESELAQLADCLEIAALQAIRWFGRQPLQFRVVK